MARKHIDNVKYFNNKYLQGTLSDKHAQRILSLREEHEVPALRNIITNAPEFVRTDIIKSGDQYIKDNKTLEGYEAPHRDKLGVGTLRPEQTVGAAFMYYAESALLGDEVGLGKTVQVAALVQFLKQDYESKGKQFRYLFLAETSTASEIREKLVQFTGDYVGFLEQAIASKVKKFINLNTPDKQCSMVATHPLISNSEFLMFCAKSPYDLIIVDESSVGKNQSTAFHKNCKSLFALIPRKILLNATPFETDLREMYNQLDLLDASFMLPLKDFNGAYVKNQYSPYGWGAGKKKYKNGDHFKETISLRYLARTRDSQGAKYENNNYRVIYVHPSEEQKFLRKRSTLRQMIDDFPEGVDRDINFDVVTTPKLAALEYMLRTKQIDPKNGQLAIYCRFIECQNQMADFLREWGYNTVVLNGTTGMGEERQAISKEFRAGKFDIIITNVLKGLDLTECDNALLYSIDPNPQRMVQFEGRITREFDIVNKSVFMLVAMGPEKKYLEEQVKLRVKGSNEFTYTGNSMVRSAILEKGNKEVFNAEYD